LRTQKEAERAEQQRIKSLVLNYDLTTDDQQDGESEPAFHYVLSPNSKRTRLVGKGVLNKSLSSVRRGNGQSQHQTNKNDDDVGESCGLAVEARPPLSPLGGNFNNTIQHPESLANEAGTLDTLGQPRLDKSGNTRVKQRSRKLQLGDIDWYGNKKHTQPAATEPPQAQASLDDYVVDRGGMRSKRAPQAQRGSQRQIRSHG
jgi:regulator of nonsense transcripts 2